jgi:hypothetical protein
MDIAALILSVISLLVSLGFGAWFMASKLSTHTVQMVSAESLLGGKKEDLGLEDFELDDDEEFSSKH